MNSHIVPPGFRFHPTDEELVDYYLRKRVASKEIDLNVIKDVDLYRIEPWDIDELCRIGTEDQSDYYFFSHKDKKYPTGTRTNRATKAGFWKATGRDKAIFAKHSFVGMRKTLVFYKGRAPNGQKLDWIMHEYRLETNENAAPQEEGWVVCRVFKKKMVATTMRVLGDNRLESPCWYNDHASYMPHINSPMRILSSQNPNASSHNHPPNYCKKEQHIGRHYALSQEYTSFLELPQFESPKILVTALSNSASYDFADQVLLQNYQLNISNNMMFGNSSNSFNDEQQALDLQASTDWRVLDKFVASQLSHEDASERDKYLNNGTAIEVDQEADMSELVDNGSNKFKTGNDQFVPSYF